MCGICGMVNGSGQAVDPRVLSAMMNLMRHRGPDDEGMWCRRHVGVGFRRLSILDLAGGHQPMTGEDPNIVAVVNGEIYNYQALRAQLQREGHHFGSHSDAEVIPHLYEEGGIDRVVRDLRGMFAVAIWDGHDESLYLIRDHFGIKPLYYSSDGQSLRFASEIRSLLASLSRYPAINWQALWHFFTFQYVPDPLTMFQGIYHLPAGHYLRFHREQLSITRYWELQFAPSPELSIDEASTRIRGALRDSVTRHMQSDVKWGAYLSSGIDSSLVVALLREHAEVDTFSIGFSGQHHEINELQVARMTAEALNTRHHEVEISQRTYEDSLPKIIAAQEEPIADPSAPALYFLAQEARKYVTVILSGEGADELFGGYPIYQEPLALSPFRRMPQSLKRTLRRAAEILPSGMKGRGYIERGTTALNRRFIGNAKMFSDEEKQEFLRGSQFAHLHSSFSVTDPYYEATQHLDEPAQMQTVDCHTWLTGDILMKADKMSMAHSLELRVPFLDVEVFEKAARELPPELRVNRATTKVALRKAAEGIVPDMIVNRPKVGFPIPIVDWIAHDMNPFIRDVFASVRPDFVEPNYFQDLLDSRTYVWNRDRKIWTGLTFLLWYRAFFSESADQQNGILHVDNPVSSM